MPERTQYTQSSVKCFMNFISPQWSTWCWRGSELTWTGPDVKGNNGSFSSSVWTTSVFLKCFQCVRSTPCPVLTWKFEPLGHLARVRPGRFSSLCVCRWVSLSMRGPAGVRLWRKRQFVGARGGWRGCWGLEHAAELGEENRKDTNKYALVKRACCFYFRQELVVKLFKAATFEWGQEWDQDLNQRRSDDLVIVAKGQQVGVTVGKRALSLEGLENSVCVYVYVCACVEEMRAHGGTCCLGRTSKGFQWWQLCDRKIGWLPRDTSTYTHPKCTHGQAHV